LSDPLALLSDHAHLEKKAATNALELLNRWPQDLPPDRWVATMAAVARDEVEHLSAVCRILERRGGKLARQHRNDYASRLREIVRRGEGPNEIIDRLLVSALIECRSCERFKLLGEASEDVELRKLYRGLWASEHGHYLIFLELAMLIEGSPDSSQRWSQLLDMEAQIIARQPPGPSMHSGCELT